MEANPVKKGFDGRVHDNIVTNAQISPSPNALVVGSTPYIAIQRYAFEFTPTFAAGSVVLSNQTASYNVFSIGFYNVQYSFVSVKLDAAYVSNSGATFPLTITTSPTLPLPASAQQIILLWTTPSTTRPINGTVQTNGSLYFPAANGATFLASQFWSMSGSYETY
jgi:hypothetical protein